MPGGRERLSVSGSLDAARPSHPTADLLADAERILQTHTPAEFVSVGRVAAAECIEYMRAVEDRDAWQASYPTLEAFYAAHEARHPCIRVHAAARREIATSGPLRGPGGTIAQRISRLCQH